MVSNLKLGDFVSIDAGYFRCYAFVSRTGTFAYTGISKTTKTTDIRTYYNGTTSSSTTLLNISLIDFVEMLKEDGVSEKDIIKLVEIYNKIHE